MSFLFCSANFSRNSLRLASNDFLPDGVMSAMAGERDNDVVVVVKGRRALAVAREALLLFARRRVNMMLVVVWES